MELLLLARRALASPTMCRFIPALSVPDRPSPIVRPRSSVPDRRAQATANWKGEQLLRLQDLKAGRYANLCVRAWLRKVNCA